MMDGITLTWTFRSLRPCLGIEDWPIYVLHGKLIHSRRELSMDRAGLDPKDFPKLGGGARLQTAGSR